MSHLMAFGMGYSARRVARRLAGEGWQVSGSARTAEGAAVISAAGWQGLIFDGLAPSQAVTESTNAITHALVSVPPDADGDPVLRWHASDLAGAGHLGWIGYFSTVGVYGDHQGRVVDEDTACTPTSERGHRRCRAEEAWRAFGATTGKRVSIFRLPGIYGPGRSVIDQLRAGTARRIVKPGQVFNRIHVDDIANAVAAAIRLPTKRDTFNISDDEPASSEDVLVYAAQLLGLPAPEPIAFDAANLSAMAASFYAESKRVSNLRMKTQLSVSLDFPTFREGLRALVIPSLDT